MIPELNLAILYVADPINSSNFYKKLLKQEPSFLKETYATFNFKNGFNLGLWSIQAKNFVSSGVGHRSEVAFMVKNEQEIDNLYDDWVALGVDIEQKPMQAVFGKTFVALDPDGHRIRVCLPEEVTPLVAQPLSVDK